MKVDIIIIDDYLNNDIEAIESKEYRDKLWYFYKKFKEFANKKPIFSIWHDTNLIDKVLNNG